MRARLVRSENVWMRVPMLADTIHRLKWLIASAPPSKAFVTCDAPVIITRPPNHSPLMGVVCCP